MAPAGPPALSPGDEMRRSTSVRLLLALAAVSASLAVLHVYVLAIDPFHIERERAHRRFAAALGQPLSGTPDLRRLDERLAAERVKAGAPVFIRIFKAEFELELWMLREGRFTRFASYPICRWSGQLGPKLHEGDRQAPEGFYTVDAAALNPDSRWHRSFNLGFPNALDRAHDRTGSFLMVHGGCSSIGCYAMTDAVIDEIWRLVTAAFGKGQARIPVHVFPFRMTSENLELVRDHQWLGFWGDLRIGHDHFESKLLPPRVTVCDGRYKFEDARAMRDWTRPIEVSCTSRKDDESGKGGA